MGYLQTLTRKLPVFVSVLRDMLPRCDVALTLRHRGPAAQAVRHTRLVLGTVPALAA